MKESQCHAHHLLRSEIPPPSVPKADIMPGFNKVNKTGVIYVTSRATDLGYFYGNPEWANFGQGAPEVGSLPGAEPRPTTITWPEDANEYAPVTGTKKLREKVAELYNKRYRVGKASQYTFENVCIVPGGRAALTRLAAAIGDVYVGFFLPDYTAYEEVLSIFKKLVPIPEALKPKDKYQISAKKLRSEIIEKGLSVILESNPCNPTGQVVQGERLKERVDCARENHCTLILDEFYSSYIYTHAPEEGVTISGAAHVEDVDKDPIVIVDGLTKNWRLPGWRVCWILGPKTLIESVSSAGSFLEGGANHPLQQAAIPLLDYEFAQKDVVALQKHFKGKRDYILERLKEIPGITVDWVPEATFYMWLNLSGLPAAISNGLRFFEECLKEKVIVVPGIFFDVNPGKRRELYNSPYQSYVRLSFGPSMETIQKGLDAIARVVKKHTH